MCLGKMGLPCKKKAFRYEKEVFGEKKPKAKKRKTAKADEEAEAKNKGSKQDRRHDHHG